MAINLLSHQAVNTGTYKTTLVFIEDFITLEVAIQGFNTSKEAEEFAKLRWSLCLEGENMYLFLVVRWRKSKARLAKTTISWSHRSC